jgi:hypothetical protein
MENKQLSIFEIAKETIDDKVVNKIKDDILIFNSANNETKNEMFKVAAQKARIIENYGAILYETANNIADQLDDAENKLALAVNSGELSKESIDKINSSQNVISSGRSNRLKKELNSKLISSGMKPLSGGDRICIIRK